MKLELTYDKEKNEAHDTVTNPFGGVNSLVTVPPEPP
jgi:hypothetical protein